jgi:hypothetical protein
MLDESARRKGGKNRNRFLAPQDRAEIARAGARARWAKADPERDLLPKAICGNDDKPLILGEVAVPAYVLDDERRVIALGGFTDCIGMARGGSMIRGMNRLELFVTRARLRPFVSDAVFEKVRNPVVFLTPTGGRAYGYSAEVLIDICEAVVAASAAQVLQPQQKTIARNCAALLRGITRVGLVALIDEATGFQEVRRRDALRRLLEAFVAPELLPWVKRFPDEYYAQLYRLHGWKRDPLDRRKPQYLGKLTARLVYDKLPLGVRSELERRNPVQEENGRRRYKHHQFLTTDIGHPVLERHMTQVIALMKVSRSMGEFKLLFRRLFPTPEEARQPELALADPLAG